MTVRHADNFIVVALWLCKAVSGFRQLSTPILRAQQNGLYVYAGMRMIDDDLGMVAPAAVVAEEQFPAIGAAGATTAGPAPYAARLAASRVAREEAAFPTLGGAPANSSTSQSSAARG